MALPEALTITNAGAESGDLSGWTTSGPPAAVASDTNVLPHGGSYMFYGGVSMASSDMYQDIDISGSSNLTAVDAGVVALAYKAWQTGWDTAGDLDEGRLWVEFYDNVMAIIGSRTSLDYETYMWPVWQERELGVGVPANTRTIRIGLDYNRVSGSNLNNYFDDLTADLVDAQARVTQEHVEALVVIPGDARVTQQHVDVLFVEPGDARVTQQHVEVIRSVTEIAPPGVAGAPIITIISSG